MAFVDGLDLSLGALIRAGSGIVYVAAGLVALRSARRPGTDQKALRAIALVALGVGVYLFVRNLAANVGGVVEWISVGAALVHTLGAAWLTQTARPRAWQWGIAAACALPITISAVLYGTNAVRAVGLADSSDIVFAIVVALQGITTGLVGGWALASSRNGGQAPVRSFWLAVATIAVLAYFEGITGDTAANGRFPWYAPVLWGLTLVPLVVAGAIHSQAGRRATGYVLMLVPYGYALLAALGTLVWPSTTLSPTGPLVGVLRTFAGAVLVYAVVRLVPSSAGQSRVPKAAVATGALAILIIVAQVMQNFLSAEYGLLTGGVIAGAVLFAANPIQRAIERATERKSAPAVQPTASSEKEESFRVAVRLALKDKNVTRDEERALLVLADHLGIRPARAFELRDEVEKFARVKKSKRL